MNLIKNELNDEDYRMYRSRMERNKDKTISRLEKEKEYLLSQLIDAIWNEYSHNYLNIEVLKNEILKDLKDLHEY
tara:strand:+ start:273 stop:497 length:225 start_codon:yes stop_codon:yes gene_type:complete